MFDAIDLPINQAVLIADLKKKSFLRRIACGHIAVKGKVSLCVCLETFSPLLSGGLLADTKGPFFYLLCRADPTTFILLLWVKRGSKRCGGGVVGAGSLKVTVYTTFSEFPKEAATFPARKLCSCFLEPVEYNAILAPCINTILQ